jgi:hypothetical protein
VPIPLPKAREAAVEVSAAAFRVDPSLISAESRGRGPKPPKHVSEAKKVAVYITVALSGCPYAEVARFIGYHRDTVCSHCADVRLATDDVEFEQRLQELIGLALARCAAPEGPSVTFGADVPTRELLLTLHAKVDRLFAFLGVPGVGVSSVHPTIEPNTKKNVVPFPGAREA